MSKRIQPGPQRVRRHKTFLRWTSYGALGSTLHGLRFMRFVEPWWIEISHTVLPVRNLPADLDGLEIAHLTDLHYSPVTLAEIERWVDMTNHLEPDLVVLTGDFVTTARGDIREAARGLRGLKARLGAVACLGNHDYGFAPRGPKHLEHGLRSREALESAGIEVLINQYSRRKVGDSVLHLAGSGDLWTDDFDENFLADAPGSPLVLLAHNPHTVYHLKHPNFDVMLSGHTHGGKVGFARMFGPSSSQPIERRPLREGHYLHQGKHIYVNRGLGYLTPLKFRARPEIAMIVLRRAKVV